VSGSEPELVEKAILEIQELISRHLGVWHPSRAKEFAIYGRLLYDWVSDLSGEPQGRDLPKVLRLSREKSNRQEEEFWAGIVCLETFRGKSCSDLISWIIGDGGSRVKTLSQDYNCHITCLNEKDVKCPFIYIEGSSQSLVRSAVQDVEKRVKQYKPRL
jgi:hypothetical protein